MRQPEPWHRVWMAVCHTVARRSRDPSFQAGAVLVDDDNVLMSVGFNGPSSHSRDDFDWADRDRKHLTVIHAESNCLWYATGAYGRRSVHCCTMYVNGRPCHRCTLEAVRAGLRAIIYDDTGPQAKMCDSSEWQRSLAVAADGHLELAAYSTLNNGG